jgi:hypothetical protein
MSASAGPIARALLSLLGHLRGAAARLPVASLVALALAGVAVVVTLRRTRPRRLAGGGGGGGGGRDGARPRGLAGVRSVTIGADVAARGAGGGNGDHAGPLFERVDGGVLAVRLAALPYLKRFAKMCDMYVIARVAEDGVEDEVRGALRDAGVFEAGMDERKVLFCETIDGRVSVVRQLEPHLHIDPRADIVISLQRFIRFVAVVAPGASAVTDGPTGANVLMYDCLESFWTPPPPQSSRPAASS